MGPSIQTYRIHRKIKGITSNFDFLNDFKGGRGLSHSCYSFIWYLIRRNPEIPGFSKYCGEPFDWPLKSFSGHRIWNVYLRWIRYVATWSIGVYSVSYQYTILATVQNCSISVYWPLGVHFISVLATLKVPEIWAVAAGEATREDKLRLLPLPRNSYLPTVPKKTSHRNFKTRYPQQWKKLKLV